MGRRDSAKDKSCYMLFIACIYFLCYMYISSNYFPLVNKTGKALLLGLVLSGHEHHKLCWWRALDIEICITKVHVSRFRGSCTHSTFQSCRPCADKCVNSRI